ncbi:MBL fold metallo-hydrolase [Streptomyces sp. NPDC056909]|uniref:MBL fold metallo-hydrolase n=1 Tax=Streptomyces sp. NPDC056909 TaxID=3345963 RepID=UPI003685235C
MDIHPIRDGISTVYLVIDDGAAMLVDAATPALAPKVLAKLTETRAKLRLIVLTHFHYDHVGGADAVREATGARVAIHHADSGALRAGGQLHVIPRRPLGRVLAPSVMRGSKAPVIPDLELDDDEDLTQHGGIGRSFWTPGHTPGSASVQLPTGTVLAGDAFGEALFPRHGAERPLFADDLDTARRSQLAIIDAARGDVRVAHYGRLQERSLAKLAQRLRGADTRPAEAAKVF